MRYNISGNLENFVKNIVDTAIEGLPTSYPCKVVSVENNFVEVQTLLKSSEVDTNTKIPILQSPYLTLPIKEGDIGLALNCSFLFENILQGRPIEENLRTSAKNALFFVPLIETQKNENDIKATTLCSQDLKNKFMIKDDGVSLECKENPGIFELKGLTLKSSEGITIEATKDATIKGENIKVEATKDAIFKGSNIKMQSTQDTTIKGINIAIQAQAQAEIKGSTATLGEVLYDLCDVLVKANLDPVAGNGAPLASPNLAAGLPTIIAKIKGSFK